MNRDIDNGIESLRMMKLSPEEKRDIRAALMRYREAAPVASIRPHNPLLRVLAQVFSPSPRLAFAFIALLAIGGSSLAAEAALPGDVLYPIKVSLTEPIRSVAYVSPARRAEWEAAKVVRRLEEAELLAAQRSFDARAREVIGTLIEAHDAAMDSAIADLVEEDDIETALESRISYEASIFAHSRLIKKVGDRSVGAQRDELAALERSLREEHRLPSFEVREGEREGPLPPPAVLPVPVQSPLAASGGGDLAALASSSSAALTKKKTTVANIIEKARKDLTEQSLGAEGIAKLIYEDTKASLDEAEAALNAAGVSGEDEAYSSLIESSRAAQEAAESLKLGKKLGKKLKTVETEIRKIDREDGPDEASGKGKSGK